MNVMYKVIYPLFAIAVIAVVVISVVSLISSGQEQQKNQEPQNQETIVEQEPQEETFTTEDLEKANTKENCLLAYNDEVFFVTEKYFSEHPGGSKTILDNCGKDVSSVFDRVHKEGGKAIEDLQQFKVGILVKKTEQVLEDDSTFSLEDVTKANTIQNCLVVYENKVYKIPQSWATQHPGGSANIINACGRDISNDFDNAHTGSVSALNQLEQFYAGDLDQ